MGRRRSSPSSRSCIPERVTVRTVQRNTGVAANVNRGLGAVRGDLIALLSGDDVMAPDKLERQVAAMEDRPDAVLCHHDAEVFESPGDRVLGRFSELYNGRLGVRSGDVELAFDAAYLLLPSTFMLRAKALPAGGFDERLRFANELLWHIQVMRRGSTIGLPEALVRYRRHAGNMTKDSSYDAARLEEFLMTMSIVTARHPELAGAARRRGVGYLLEAAAAAAATGDRRRAARLSAAAIGHAGPLRGSSEALRLAQAARRRRAGRTDDVHLALAGPPRPRGRSTLP